MKLLFRLAIAVVLGISISHPITLSIFNDSIAVEINKTKAEERNNIIRLYKEKKLEDESNIEKYKANRKEIEENRDKKIAEYGKADMSQYLPKNSTSPAPENDNNPYKQQQEQISSEILQLKEYVDAININKLELIEKAVKEIRGNGITGKPGCGAICKLYQNQVKELGKQSENIQLIIKEKQKILENIQNVINENINDKAKEDDQRRKDTNVK